MSILRVHLPAPPDAARADAWALYDAAGELIDRGHGPPASWPSADRREAVIAADAVRIFSLALPPLPASRIAAAARFAVEDRLATAADESAVAVGRRSPDGKVAVLVLSRELADALQRHRPPFDRAVAESELALPGSGWRWCESADASFVRTEDGSAFPVSHTGDESLPPELTLALAQAVRQGRAPALVIADREADGALLAEWERATGIPFRAGIPWRWDTATASVHAGTVDLIAGTRRAAEPTPTAKTRFAAAWALIGIALGFHILATLGTWVWRQAELARTRAALIPIARELGATGATLGNARAEIARAYADARHRAGLMAPADALPLLARAAPALASLPPGTLRTATYAGGAWTLELTALDDTALATLVRRWTEAGIGALYARHANGVRARIGLAS